MNNFRLFLFLTIIISLTLFDFATAQTTVTIGAGTSSSSTRGPMQRADTASSTVFSRFVHVYTASELAAVGITNGVAITDLNWELASSNVIIGSGDATFKVYIKNSTATAATADSWTNLVAGSTLVVDNAYNTTNNFPGANGWMPFAFSAPFTYTGGALEIAVDWDCSQVSTPAFSGNGAIKWRWESIAPDFLVVKKTSSSSPSSNITDLKDERANIQIVYSAALCASPTSLHANNVTTTSADLVWIPTSGAMSYNWKVVAAGAGSAGTAVDSGNSTTGAVSTTSLSELTAYDLFVEADCGAGSTSGFAGPYSFLTKPQSTTAVTIGAGSSSSSSRGPFQRSDTASTTVFSRFVHIYTASELAAAGVVPGTAITELNWELASSNVMIGAGDASLKVYIKNSMATMATADSWANLVTGSTLVVDEQYNTFNNFPGMNGWMPFAFSSPYVYTGGALEVAVDWDCSQVTTPAFSGDGSLKWRWESTAPDLLVVKKTSSSSPSSNITDLKDERANIQFVFETPECAAPYALTTTNVMTTSADFSWSDSTSADGYDWIVVLAGAGPMGTAVDMGTTTNMMVSTSSLAAATSYDLFVEADCGVFGTSGFSDPRSFTTLCAATPPTMITTDVTNVLCNGESSGAIDMTVTAGVPSYTFNWSNAATTEDLTGLAAGLYTVEITDGNGCPYTDSVTVMEPAMALTTMVTTMPDTANLGLGAVSVVASGGTPPYAYTWDGVAGSSDSTGLETGTYLLEVTDANGCTESVGVLVDNILSSVPTIDQLTSLSIAPNPTAGRVQIQMTFSKTSEVGISVYSVHGELLEDVLQENTNLLDRQLDLSGYAPGMYFIQFKVDHQVLTKKIVLQR